MNLGDKKLNNTDMKDIIYELTTPFNDADEDIIKLKEVLGKDISKNILNKKKIINFKNGSKLESLELKGETVRGKGIYYPNNPPSEDDLTAERWIIFYEDYYNKD